MPTKEAQKVPNKNSETANKKLNTKKFTLNFPQPRGGENLNESGFRRGLPQFPLDGFVSF